MLRILPHAPVILLGVLLAGCGDAEPEAPKDLVRAARVITYMASPRHFNRSGFASARERKPSAWVGYLFSDMGASEWPASEQWADEMERQQMASIGAPMVPAGVTYSPRKIDRAAGRQIVVRADDEKGLVIVEGYVDAASTPVLVREIQLPAGS